MGARMGREGGEVIRVFFHATEGHRVGLLFSSRKACFQRLTYIFGRGRHSFCGTGAGVVGVLTKCGVFSGVFF